MTDLEFTPSAHFTVPEDGRRDLALVFIGDSLVTGVGDPKGQGWVSRVVGRTHAADLEVTAYNLGVRDETTTAVLQRWHTEVPTRWAGRTERRLVVSVGVHDITSGVSLARHRLGLANILDEAATQGVATFVVSPPPIDLPEDELEKLSILVDAQADLCARRGVPFVDTFGPLSGHDQWRSDLAASRVPRHPGQAGYGLMAWLVLNNGWSEWLGL